MRAQKLFDIVWTKSKKHYHAKKYNKISIPRKMEEYWPNEEEVNYFSPVLLTSHGVYRRFTEKIPFRFYWEYILKGEKFYKIPLASSTTFICAFWLFSNCSLVRG